MTCSSSGHLLFILALIYGILSAATFIGLYFIYQTKLEILTEQCLQAKVSDTEPGVIVTENVSGEKDLPTGRPPVYTDIKDTGCVCPKRSIIENGYGEVTEGGKRNSERGDLGRSHHESLLQCCTRNDTTLHEKIVQWTENLQESGGVSQTGQLSAVSVVGSDTLQLEEIGDSQVVRGWAISNERQSGYVEGIQFDDYTFVVPRDGYYFVHSKISFKTSNDRPHSIGHSTSVASEDRPEDQNLMHSEKLHPCSSHSSGGTYSSFHSGIFKLYRDDRVYVRLTVVPNDIVVTPVAETSSFGMYFFSP